MRRARTRLTAALALSGLSLACWGCAIGALIGGMEQSRREHSTHAVDGEYDGIEGQSFAVIVTADRLLQADYPQLVPQLSVRISERLKDNVATATGYVPAQRLLQYMYEHPNWDAEPYSDLAKRLGVTRLVVIELDSFRLHEPGNQYLWAGVATGSVAVIEADSPLPDEYAFLRTVSVGFPDQKGYGPSDISEAGVLGELLRRFTDRASWLFYEHQEPYYPDY